MMQQQKEIMDCIKEMLNFFNVFKIQQYKNLEECENSYNKLISPIVNNIHKLKLFNNEMKIGEANVNSIEQYKKIEKEEKKIPIHQ